MSRQAVLRAVFYAAVFILFTLVFTVVNFPSERLTEQVNARLTSATGGAVSAGAARIRIPYFLVLDGLTVVSADKGPADFGSAVVKPRLLSMMMGKTAADVELTGPWFSSEASVVLDDGAMDLEILAAESDLSGLPEDLFGMPLAIDGTVRMTASIHSDDTDRGITAGFVSIASGPISISGDVLQVFGIAPLEILRISLDAAVEDNVLKIGENRIEGDLQAAANGVIRLSPGDYSSSRLDLTLKIRPGPGREEALTPVFGIMGARPGSDGTVSIRVRGTAGRPSISM